MGIKEINGNYKGVAGDFYHKIGGVTGLQFGEQPQVHVTVNMYLSEEYYIENPNEPLDITHKNIELTIKQADDIKKILYSSLKKHIKEKDGKEVDQSTKKQTKGIK